MRMRALNVGVLLPAMLAWSGITLPRPAHAQDISGAERHVLLAAARARYYSLTSHGVRSFTCRVKFDFDTVSKGLLPPDDEADRHLLESAVFALKVGPGGPVLRYRFPEGSVSQSQETVAAVTLWVSELVQGFFQTWPPKGFDGPVPQDAQVKEMVRDGEGYRIAAKVDGVAVELRMDKDSAVTEISRRGGTEMERPRFGRTASGLVYSGGQEVDLDGQSRTETSYTIETSSISGVLLPREVHLRVGAHVDVRWDLSGCSVEQK